MNEDSCLFCDVLTERILFENRLIFSTFDKFPVSPGHILVIPFRHVSSFWELQDDEMLAIKSMLKRCKIFIDKKFTPDAYNVGVNIGKPAGQTIMHVHIHLIPRYEGDVENPVGGVRNTIPGKGNYLQK